MSTTIGPAIGHGLILSQAGTGASPGYDAADIRRMFQGVAAEGVLSSGSYAVTQRGAGANMTVDIAASTGEGVRVQGDAVTLQGLYYVPPHSAVINESIAAADATNPRNDLVVLEIKDTTHDASGSNLAQTRVVTGTPNASAAQTDALGVNGTPSLPASAIPLAVVNVPATDTSITTSQIDDRRPFVWHGGSGGKSIITTEEARTNTAYAKLTTPDVVKNVVLPTDGIICISYQAMWKESVSNAARAAIFLGANQIKVPFSEGPTTGTTMLSLQAARTGGPSTGTYYGLGSGSIGLAGIDQAAVMADPVTTGQVLGLAPGGGSGEKVHAEIETNGSSFLDVSYLAPFGGHVEIEAAAGTYDVSVQFKATSGTVTAKNRRLRVWVISFG